MYTNFEQSMIGNVDLGLDGTSLRLQAAKAFNLAVARGRLGQLLAAILRKQNQLQTLTCQPVSPRRPTNRIVSVPIRQIKGSLGRCNDFDTNFNPLQERSRSRWISIAIAIQMDIPLPPIELVQVGEAFFVQDGHHRISVAKTMGQEMIDARIVS